jgi:hypothetical protein
MTPNATLQRHAACGHSGGRTYWKADRSWASCLKECQQVGVELVLVCIREAVGGARIDL